VEAHIIDLATDQRLVQKHSMFYDAAVAAVQAGELPAAIYNTTKIYPDFPRDLYELFGNEMDRYTSDFGDSVRVTYGEWNYAEIDNLSAEQIPACAAFLLVMCRLRADRGDQLFACNYQQGYAVGTSNIIGLDGPARRGNWTSSAFTDFWLLFGNIIERGQYLPSHIARPADTYLEAFAIDGDQVVLYANRDTVAVDINLGASSLTFHQSTNPQQTAAWTGSLPPLSAGVITLNP